MRSKDEEQLLDDRRGSLGKEQGGNNGNVPEAKRRRYGKKGKEYGEMGKEYGEMGKEFGEIGKELGKELGGNTNNPYNKERSLAASQACETCTQCSRLLTSKFFWPEDWRHRTQSNMKIMCKECCPTPRKERLSGYLERSQQNSIDAAARPITCKVCKRSLPRSQFRPLPNGKYQINKGLTCEQCRAEGKLPQPGRKRQRADK